MSRRVAAILGGVLLGIVFAFARAGAFPFWSSSDKDNRKSGAAPATQPAVASQAQAAPAPANQPEPNEHTAQMPSFAPLVKRMMPTVVNVSVVQKPGGTGDEGGEGGEAEPGPSPGPAPGPLPFGQGGGDPFEQFRRFFNEPQHEYKQHGLGSGVIVSPDGYILTNNHVAGNAEEIHVTLMDKREFTAKVIGKDPKSDIALIKINTKDPLPTAELGNSDSAQVGDWVVAIGNPFGFSLTVTAGIVSAKGRILGGNYDDFIQTDASINPGNSGGPLFDTNGKVVGINTAIYSRTGTSLGIGFAVPIDLVKNVMEQLKASGHVVRGWLGVQIQEVTSDLAQSFGLPKPEGALVAGIEKDSPASKAGFQRGDVIISFNGKPIQDEHELPTMVSQTPINKTVQVDVIRNGKHMALPVTITALKDSEIAKAQTEEPGGDWGLQIAPITPDLMRQFNLSSDKGVVVRSVKPDTPAADAGLQAGDVVLEINSDKIKSIDDFLAKAKSAKKDSKPTRLLVQRGDASIYVVIKPAQG